MSAQVLTADAAKAAQINLTEGHQGSQALHETVVAYRANRRQGTACTKNRSEVSGSGKKLWNQKGTGNARMGSKRSPIWSGGGVVFGPRPRDYSKKTPKNVKKLALRAALTARINDGAVLTTGAFAIADGKVMLLGFSQGAQLALEPQDLVARLGLDPAVEHIEAIARQVGFKDVSFQFEPIGAALHYEASLSREELVLIADIGGGTADFSLVRLSPERAKHADRADDLLGNAGLHVGGTDFDRALSLECVMPLLGYKGLMKSGAEIPSSLFFQLATWHTINSAYTRQAFADFQNIYRDAAARRELDRLARLIGQREGHWLALQVEQAKIDLSAGDTTLLHLDRLETGLAHRIDREDFALATRSLVERVAATVGNLLDRTGVAREKVDTLYFTGGASGVPQLRARIAAELPQARSVEGDLFGSIGAGLAVEAARRYG